MKIGIDCRIYSSKFTGIGRYVYELVKHIPQFDKNNEYVLFFNKDEFDFFKPPTKQFSKVLVDAPIYSFKEQTHFLKILNKAELDLMHFTHFNGPIFYKRPSVVTIHDLTLTLFPGKKKSSPIFRLGYHLTIRSTVKKAKKIITISKNTKHDLEYFLKTPSKKIEVVYLGVAEEFKQLTNPKSANATLKKHSIQKPFFLYTGVWRSHKNLPNLIKAFQKVKEHTKQNLQLVITGKEDPYYPEVKESVSKYGLEQEDVIFTGLVSEKELIDLYNAAELFVFPSFYEGFGLPPLEAMRCGTPVVASNVSSIPEICGEGNAVLFDPYQADDIAEKITSVYTNEALKQKLINNGLKRVKEFSWDTMTRETVNVYKKCLHN